MNLASEKSKLLIVRRMRHRSMIQSITVNGSLINASSSVNDLGITIREDLEPSDHISEIARKSQKKANHILRALSTKDISTYKKAFVSLIRPILEYGSQIWCRYMTRI
jgi:hypothetical protein